MKETIVSKAEFARRIGRSHQRVSQLVQKGMPGVQSDGRIDVGKATAWLEKYTSGYGGGWGSGLRKNDRVAIKADQTERPKCSDYFESGARWMAQAICAHARRHWPALTQSMSNRVLVGDELRTAQACFAALAPYMLENWLADFVDADALPEWDWSAFGKHARRLKRETEEARAQWDQMAE